MWFYLFYNQLIILSSERVYSKLVGCKTINSFFGFIMDCLMLMGKVFSENKVSDGAVIKDGLLCALLCKQNVGAYTVLYILYM
jgi:hypothetical protein